MDFIAVGDRSILNSAAAYASHASWKGRKRKREKRRIGILGAMNNNGRAVASRSWYLMQVVDHKAVRKELLLKKNPMTTVNFAR